VTDKKQEPGAWQAIIRPEAAPVPPEVPLEGAARSARRCASPLLLRRSRRAGPVWVVVCVLAGTSSLLGEMHLEGAGLALMVLAICAVGLAISRIEYAAGLPVPATPGFLFWFGHFLSFVVGGVLFWALEIDPTLGLESNALAWQIGIVTMGLGAFGVGYVLTLRTWAAAKGGLVRWPAVRLDGGGLVTGCLALALPVLAFFLVFPEYRIGVMQEAWAPEEASVIGVIVFGVLGFVRPVVLVLLGLYLIAEGRKNAAVVGLLAVVGLGQTFQATLAGGRAAILEALLACVAVMAAFRVRQTRLGRVGLVVACCAVLIAWYIPTAGQYRARTGYGGMSRELHTFSEYVSAFLEAGNAVIESPRIRDSIEAVVGRIYEPSAFRVMSAARESSEGFGFRGWGDLVFRWVPSFIREKGKDRDQDLMWQQGFKPHENSGEPLTLPADLYYRFGLLGVTLGYGVLGMLLGRLTRWCRSHLDTIRFVGLMALGVLVSRIYAVDFVHALWAPIYELPIGMGVAVLVFSGLRGSAGEGLTQLLGRLRRGRPRLNVPVNRT
jgi:hypothetical protein